MAKVIVLYPEVTVWCEELQTSYPTQPGTELGQYILTATLPPNAGDTELVYSFEVYVQKGEAEPEATGIVTYVTVGYQTIYEYHEIKSIHSSPAVLSYLGGEIIITINFHDEAILPNVKMGDFALDVIIITEDTRTYGSSAKSGTGIWKYSTTTNKFDLLKAEISIMEFIEVPQGDVYGSSILDGLWKIDQLTDEVTQVLSADGNVYTSVIIDDTGILYVSGPDTDVVSIPPSGPAVILASGSALVARDASGNIYISNEDGLSVVPGTNPGGIPTPLLPPVDGGYGFLSDPMIAVSDENSFLLHGETAPSALVPAVTIYNTHRAENGKVYGNTDKGVGIIAPTGIFTTLIPGKDLANFFEDAEGNVYVSGDDGGLYQIDPSDTVNELATVGNYKYFFITTEGEIYASGTSPENLGLWQIDTAPIRQVYMLGNSWGIWTETSDKLSVLSYQPYGEIFRDENTGLFDKNNLADPKMAGNSIGSATYYQGGGLIKVWYKGQLLIEVDGSDDYEISVGTDGEGNGILIIAREDGTSTVILITPPVPVSEGGGGGTTPPVGTPPTLPEDLNLVGISSDGTITVTW